MSAFAGIHTRACGTYDLEEPYPYATDQHVQRLFVN